MYSGTFNKGEPLQEGQPLISHSTEVAMILVALLVWPHEVKPWFHSWYRGRVETLDAKYNLIFR